MDRFTETHEGSLRVVKFRVRVGGEDVPGCAWMLSDLEEQAPLVVLQHPLMGSHADYFVEEVGRSWAMRGWICAGLDAPLHGDREPYDPLSILRDRERHQLLARKFAVEVTAVVDALAARYPVDMGRLGYVGYSLGAMLGVPAVATDGRFRAAAFCLVGEGGLAGPAQGAGSYVSGLAGVAVRIVGRTRDEVIPREATEALFNAIEGVRDLAWLSGSHYDIGPDIVDSAEEWLRTHLG